MVVRRGLNEDSVLPMARKTGDRLVTETWAVEHKFTPEMQEKTIDWLDRVLTPQPSNPSGTPNPSGTRPSVVGRSVTKSGRVRLDIEADGRRSGGSEL